MICAKTVFRCFKILERTADRVTGVAGPFFVALAIILISAGTISFFDVIFPSLPYPFLSGPICILIAVNMFAHYYFVCTVRPGFVDEETPPKPRSSLVWARPKARVMSGYSGELGLRITPATTTTCRKCGVIKPERTHHCRICNRCVLKYDHHCPVRVNQCVGIHNERHFVMFMAYLILATSCFAVLGWPHIADALGFNFAIRWDYRTPSVVFILTYILSVVLSLAVGIMCSYHLYNVSCGETTVEAQDHEVYRRVASGRGESFENSYDIGRRKNLELFFNVGQVGQYPIYTLLLPYRINPYTDGRSWARREGTDRHRGVRVGEELTDEEDDSESV